MSVFLISQKTNKLFLYCISNDNNTKSAPESSHRSLIFFLNYEIKRKLVFPHNILCVLNSISFSFHSEFHPGLFRRQLFQWSVTKYYSTFKTSQEGLKLHWQQHRGSPFNLSLRVGENQVIEQWLPNFFLRHTNNGIFHVWDTPKRLQDSMCKLCIFTFMNHWLTLCSKQNEI